MVLGVNDAAKKLGVRPERVLKLIHDGRIDAQRVGSRWIIDEGALSSRVWIKSPGRPMSAKNAASLAQALEGQVPSELDPIEKHRLQKHIRNLLAHSDPKSQLQSWLSARAQPLKFSVSESDISDLREDPRIRLSGVSDPRSGLLPGNELEAYISKKDLDRLSADWFLVPANSGQKANVILRVLDKVPLEVPAIFSAMDLAEHPGPREQSAANSIIRSVLHGDQTSGNAP